MHEMDASLFPSEYISELIYPDMFVAQNNLVKIMPNMSNLVMLELAYFCNNTTWRHYRAFSSRFVNGSGDSLVLSEKLVLLDDITNGHVTVNHFLGKEQAITSING